MWKEFERLLPLMRSGGFIPNVDHQTLPQVTLDEYTASAGQRDLLLASRGNR